MRYPGLAVLLLATAAHGQVVSHLNLVSDKSEDMSSLQAWKAKYIKDDMSPQEKAIAIFNTMTRYRHQANPPREFLGGSYEEGHVHDVLKTVNVYGYGQCCCVAGEVSGLARWLGIPARGRDITAHSVPELFYNDSWHLVDCSVMNYHLKPNGDLAGVDEIHNAIAEWIKTKPELMGDKGTPDDKKLRAFAKNGGWKNGPALLSKSDAFYGKDGVNTAGWHGWPSTMQEYFVVKGEQEFCSLMGYQLNVQLRPGEMITRNFFSRGIEYTNNMSKTYYPQLQDRKLLGIQTKLGDQAPGRVGDGTIDWQVPMDKLSTVALASDANGFTLRFPSSYVYVKSGATVKATVSDGGSVTVSFSKNNGLDWEEVAKITSSGEQTIDLRDHAKRLYDYRLKFDLSGGAKVEAIHAINDFQCSQAALPVITEGENKLTFNAGPQEGTITTEGCLEPDLAAKNKSLAVSAFKPVLNGFNEKLEMTAPQGDATFDLATPGDMTRIRTSVVWRARDKADGFYVQTSFDGGKTFTTAPNGTLEGGVKGSSRYLIVDNIPPGTKAAKLRIVGKQANTSLLFDLQICTDYKEPAGAFQPVKITYTWDESGQTKTAEHIAKTPQDAFNITCGPRAVVKSFAMQLSE